MRDLRNALCEGPTAWPIEFWGGDGPLELLAGNILSCLTQNRDSAPLMVCAKLMAPLIEREGEVERLKASDAREKKSERLGEGWDDEDDDEDSEGSEAEIENEDELKVKVRKHVCEDGNIQYFYSTE